MKYTHTLVLSLICAAMSGFPFMGNAQQGVPGPKTDRKPAAAGSFYPSGKNELRAELDLLFRKAKSYMGNPAQAIITPHAGYVFSGEVAASGFRQVDPDRAYDRVFVIASSHQVSFPGASIYNRGDYVTPLGAVPVDTETAAKLMQENKLFRFEPEADKYEHSLEVQVPFLQYHLKKSFKIVPIVMGGRSAEECKSIANSLKPYFNEKNLFVISTDFSHYPSYTDAANADKATCDAIIRNEPAGLVKFLEQYKQKDVDQLATNLCGWTSVLTLLYITSGLPGYRFVPVEYKNSGDSPYGDKDRVVGYWSIAVVKDADQKTSTSSFNLTKKDKADLLDVARKTITTFITEKRRPVIETGTFSASLQVPAGAFVTLHKDGKLRGCIGRFTAEDPIWMVVREMAIASATEDNRFRPVTTSELKEIEIEISVLTPMKKITSIKEIIPGKHGIYIKKGYSSGTFLPQVATETGWDTEELLGHCARDKAGIGWDGWRDAEIYTYEALVFSEREVNGNR